VSRYSPAASAYGAHNWTSNDSGKPNASDSGKARCLYSKGTVTVMIQSPFRAIFISDLRNPTNCVPVKPRG
jgi:hypothetical protein